jgi:hypothetical protein
MENTKSYNDGTIRNERKLKLIGVMMSMISNKISTTTKKMEFSP